MRQASILARSHSLSSALHSEALRHCCRRCALIESASDFHGVHPRASARLFFCQ